jgi:hypothetical protein
MKRGKTVCREGNMRGWLVSIALVAAAIVLSPKAAGQGAYPEPPVARQTFAITD